jgi:hypothetical protein
MSATPNVPESLDKYFTVERWAYTYGFKKWRDDSQGYEIAPAYAEMVTDLNYYKPVLESGNLRNTPTPMFKAINYDEGAIRIDCNGMGKLYHYQEPKKLSIVFQRFKDQWQYIELEMVPHSYGIHPNSVSYYNDMIDIFDYYLKQDGFSLDMLTDGAYSKI